LEDLARVFARHRVQYLLIGKSGAIVYGFPDTTQDIDIFPEKSRENGQRIVSALKELGFHLDGPLGEAVLQGKDFIQIRGEPFDVDLIFAPDGIRSFADAMRRASLLEGKYPVASIDDIIKSKRAAARQKDKEVLDRLEAFSKYLKGRKS
ncbi:MAG: hypothetical protein HYZ93_06525, partial [Candidatus Omnitrophica bacterium]|nr:hypothetical protein [Candidatus Omnitrophota bacterium]